MTVTWNVTSLEATKTVGSLSDVVTTIHWTAADKETVGSEVYLERTYGFVELADADPSSFTAYASISESDAITWVKAALGSDEVTKIETKMAARIAEAKTPTTTSGVPW